ncbi:MAG: glycosyltransferase [Opitutales bacterium]|nr:glycosyltransferase [Opitutales bacterium]
MLSLLNALRFLRAQIKGLFKRINRFTCSGTVVLFDPSCLDIDGHHFALNRDTIKYCRSQKKHLRIFVNSRCNAKARYALVSEAVSAPSVYDPLPQDPHLLAEYLLSANESAYTELNRKVGQLKSGDQVLVHTASICDVLGLYHWATELSREVQFRITLRHKPTFSGGDTVFDDEISDQIESFYRSVFEKWKRLRSQVQFLSDSQPLAREFEKLSNFKFNVVGVQVEYFNSKPNIKTTDDLKNVPIFLFAGNARPEKGLGLLPDAIDLYFDSGRDAQIVVQSLKFADAVVAERLRKHSNVTILDKSLFGQRYFDFLGQGDVVVLPYDPVYYHLRTSHIFAESLGIGCPVITSSGTWMEEELSLDDRPRGIIMEDYSSESLAKAMIAFHDKRHQLVPNAQEQAMNIRSRHNSGAYLDTMFNAS